MPLGIAINDEFVKKFGRKYPPEAVLCKEGDKGDSMFIISTGKVSILKQSVDGEKQIAELKDGEMFGEMALMGLQPFRSATVRATQETMVLELNRAAFTALMKKSPEIAMQVIKTLVQRLADTNGRVVALSHNNGFEKVTAFIQHIINSTGAPAPEQKPGKCAIVLPGQVASSVGYDANFVMKVISLGSKAGILATAGNWMWVPYPEYLGFFGKFLASSYKESEI